VQEVALEAGRPWLPPVGDVAGDGKAEGGHVDADLVGAPRLEADLGEREARGPLEDAEVGHRRPRVGGVDGHALAVADVPSDGGVHCALVLGQRPAQQGEVHPADPTPGHVRDQAAVGVLAAGDDEQAGGLLVQTVDDTWAAAVAAAQATAHETLHEGAVLVARRGVDDDAGRLVDDEDPVVLVDDAHGHVLGDERGRLLRRRRPGHRLAGAHDVPLARRPPVHESRAGGDEARRGAARHFGARGEDDVEAAPCLVPRHDERLGLRHVPHGAPPTPRGRHRRRRRRRRS